MKQNKARKGEMKTYPCREEGQQLLDHNSESSSSDNKLQGPPSNGESVWLWGGVQRAKDFTLSKPKGRDIEGDVWFFAPAISEPLQWKGSPSFIGKRG